MDNDKLIIIPPDVDHGKLLFLSTFAAECAPQSCHEGTYVLLGFICWLESKDLVCEPSEVG